MWRAAVSIASNLAEGRAQESSGDFQRFLNVAKGSLAELETPLTIAEGLGLLDERSSDKLCQMTNEESPMLSGLLESTHQES